MGKRLTWASFAVAVVGVLVAVGAWLYPNILGVDVRREPVSTAGPNPFMPPVGTDQPDVVPPPKTEGNFVGDTDGLYGGTRNSAACDPKKMVEFLQSHEDKARAWAEVLGIGPEDIPGYVAGLTPFILRSDAYVTNHGFENGRATSIPAVLQAGTAVLVNDRGVPVAKCYCGNPLTEPPDRPRRSFQGPSWPSFSPDKITVIQSAKAVITTFVVVDPKTNAVFERPSHTTGEVDQDSESAGKLPAPELTGPPDGSTFDNYPRTTVLTWNPVDGASSYRVEYEFYDPGRAQWIPRDPYTTAQTSQTIEHIGAQPGRWRVAAIASDGTRGIDSGWWEFTYTV